MTNPRRKVRFDGIVGPYATYAIDGVTIVYDSSVMNHSAAVGMAATLSGNGVVALADDGEALIGRVHVVENDNFADVQTDGYMTFAAGDGATVTVGSRVVGAANGDGDPGYIRDAANDGSEDDVAAGRVVDASDQTKIWVKF